MAEDWMRDLLEAGQAFAQGAGMNSQALGPVVGPLPAPGTPYPSQVTGRPLGVPQTAWGGLGPSPIPAAPPAPPPPPPPPPIASMIPPPPAYAVVPPPVPGFASQGAGFSLPSFQMPHMQMHPSLGAPYPGMVGQPTLIDHPSYYKPVGVSPYGRSMDAHMAYGSQMASLGRLSYAGSQAAGGQFFAGMAAGPIGGVMGAVAGGLIGGLVGGPIGAAEGVTTGWDLGQIGIGYALSKSPMFNAAATRMMRPSIERAADTSRVRGMSQNFIYAGNELGISGRGFDNTQGVVTGANGIARANNVTRQDVLNLMSAAGDNGLFSSAQETEKVIDVTKKLFGMIGSVAKLTGDPDFRRNIQTIAQIKSMGVELAGVTRQLKDLEDLARTGGVDLQTMMSTTGGFGLQVGQSMGLSGITGMRMGGGAGAVTTQFNALGTLSARQKSMLGGSEGMSSRLTQATMGYWNQNYELAMPYLLEKTSGGYGISQQRLQDLSSGRVTLDALIQGGASNLSTPEAMQNVLANKDDYLDQIMGQVGTRGTLKNLRTSMGRIEAMGTGIDRHHALKIAMGGNVDDATVRMTLQMLDSPDLQRNLARQDAASLRHRRFENIEAFDERTGKHLDSLGIGSQLSASISDALPYWSRFQNRSADTYVNSQRDAEMRELGYASTGMRSSTVHDIMNPSKRKTLRRNDDGTTELVDTKQSRELDRYAMAAARGELPQDYASGQLSRDITDLRQGLEHDTISDAYNTGGLGKAALYANFAGGRHITNHAKRLRLGAIETLYGMGDTVMPGMGMGTSARNTALELSFGTYGVGDTTLDALNQSERTSFYKFTKGGFLADAAQDIGLGGMVEDPMKLLGDVKREQQTLEDSTSMSMESRHDAQMRLIDKLVKAGMSPQEARRYAASTTRRVGSAGHRWYKSNASMKFESLGDATKALTDDKSLRADSFSAKDIERIKSVMGDQSSITDTLASAGGMDIRIQDALGKAAKEGSNTLAAESIDLRSLNGAGSRASLDEVLGDFGLGDTNTASDAEAQTRKLLMSLGREDQLALLLVAAASGTNASSQDSKRLEEFIASSDARSKAARDMTALFMGQSDDVKTKLKKAATSSRGLFTSIESVDSLGGRLDALNRGAGILKSAELDNVVASKDAGAQTAMGLIQRYRSSNASGRKEILKKAGVFASSLTQIDAGADDNTVLSSMFDASADPSASYRDIGAAGTPTNREVDSLTQQYFDASMEAASTWSTVGRDFGGYTARFGKVVEKLERLPLLMSKSDTAAVTNPPPKPPGP